MLILNKINKIIILGIIILLVISSNTLGVVKPTNDFYVNDYAGVLSSETEAYIIQANVDLEQKTGAQIVIVTVNSLEGYSIEEYATELFRNFGIGDKNKNNGVLLLCSTGDRMFRIEVGYGLEGRLTDGKTGRIQDEYIIPYLKNDNYDEGIKNGFSAVLEEIAAEYGVTIEGALQAQSSYSGDGYGTIFILVITMLITSYIEKIFKISKKKKSTRIWIRLLYICALGIATYYLTNIVVSVLVVIVNIITCVKKPGVIGRGRILIRWRILS